MKRIAVITSTRAEYGLLSPIIKELRKLESEELKVELIVTGTHLSHSYGNTINEIDDRIDVQVEIPVKSDSENDISKNQAECLVKFTKLFVAKTYNAIILLGDRYEILSVAIAAGNTKTPVFHISGGDTTEGAIDEWIRHSITKISYLHFVTNEESKRRVIQLGESPNRVYNFGSTSIDNILKLPLMSKIEALKSVGLNECRYALCTYHPVTMEKGTVEEQISTFLEAIKELSDIVFIVTKSNSDQGGSKINMMLDEANTVIKNLHVFSSLGTHRYLSLMKSAEFVMGNSSSGIIEAPALKVPTVNIGNRQKGRLQSESVISCASDKNGIIEAVKMAVSTDFKKICERVISPYGKGDAAVRIANCVVETVINKELNLQKKFYDIDFEV